MLKPKNHLFKVKIMINKLEAINNKVSSRCLATLQIDNESIHFQNTPQFNKNVALFNSELEYDNYSLYYDEVTGLYQNKTATIIIEIQTQGTKIKIGESIINMGEILNDKKYRIVSYYPLNKCYDKAAKLKLSVDFLPLSIANNKSQRAQHKERSQFTLRNHETKLEPTPQQPYQQFQKPNYKSRMAEESTNILQEKLYEYEQKLDNYRLSQTQLQEKMHEQIANKDDQITSLNIELSHKNQTIAQYSLQNEQLRYRVKDTTDQLSQLRENNKSLVVMVENLQNEEEVLKKQGHSLRTSLENHIKTKENKQKYYGVELAKYTQRYLQSEQERNRIIFELESKFKQQSEKKELNYKGILSSSDKKYNEVLSGLRQRIKRLEQYKNQQDNSIQLETLANKKLTDSLALKTREFLQATQKYEETSAELHQMAKLHTEQSNQLETMNFSYQEMERQFQKCKQDSKISLRQAEQLKMQLVMANQTIEEQRKNLLKLTKELQVHQEREYYLTQKYNDQIQIKSIHQENIRGQSIYYRQQLYKLKNKLAICQERLEEESHQHARVQEVLHRLEAQLSNKNKSVVMVSQQKLLLQNELKYVKDELCEMQQGLLQLKEENMRLSDSLRDKSMALQNDKSVEWSYKIQQLQEDISQMLQKFKAEKDLLRQSFKKEDNKRKEQTNILNQMLRKSKDENEDLKKIMHKQETVLKNSEKELSEVRHALRNRASQVVEARQKIKSTKDELEEWQSRWAKKEEQLQHLSREVEQRRQKQVKDQKRVEVLKGNLNRVIAYLLQYITKSKASHLTYQELSSFEKDTDLISIINLSVRKYCEEHNKIKDHIKGLQKQALNNRQHKEFKTFQPIYKSSFDKKQMQDESQYGSLKNRQVYDKQYHYRANQSFNLASKDHSYEAEALREENSKLKKQIAEHKVKIRSIEEQMVKAERSSENEKCLKEGIKGQMEQIQDELEKMRFNLKKKQKIMVQYENEMRELQTELLSYKNITTFSTNKHNGSSDVKIKQRQGRNGASVKDLQHRLEQKMKQNEVLCLDLGKYKAEVVHLKENIAQLNAELKTGDQKLKDKNMKIIALEDQYNHYKSNVQNQYASEFSKFKAAISSLQEEKMDRHQEMKRAEQKMKQLESEICEQERKVRLCREQGALGILRQKKQYELAIAQLKQQILNRECSTTGAAHGLNELNARYKQLLAKNNGLVSLLQKRSEEVDRNVEDLNDKSKKMYELQERVFESSKRYESLIAQLKQTIQEWQQRYTKKDYELEEYIFTSESRTLELQKRLDEALNPNAH